MSRTYFGCVGHFIMGSRCRFHLHTHVGGHCVSTVGELLLSPTDTKFETVGVGRLYETMVFKLAAGASCGSGDHHIDDYEHVDFAGYNDHDAANEGHDAMCQKYEAL